MARPEGQRCLLVSGSGCTSSRLRSGSLLHRFRSMLPGGGGPRSSGDSSGPCMLDAIFQAADGTGGTYYLLDLLVWKVC